MSLCKDGVGYYVVRWAIIWNDGCLSGHMGIYLEDVTLVGQSGPYMDMLGSYVDRVGFYLHRWVLIWTYGPLFGRWAFIWTGGSLYGQNGLLSTQMGPYMDRLSSYVDRVGFHLDR